MEKKKFKIGVDVDNTLLGCNSLLYNFLCNFTFNSPNSKLKFSAIEQDADMKSSNPFLKKLKFFNPTAYYEVSNSVEIINKLKEEGNEIYLITSRPNTNTSISSLQTWLREKEVRYDYLYIGCTNKVALAKSLGIDYMVDDAAKTCANMAKAGIKAINFKIKLKQDAAQHEKFKNQDFKVLGSWQDIYSEISQEYDGQDLKLTTPKAAKKKSQDDAMSM